MSMILHPGMDIWANAKPPLGVLTGWEVTAGGGLNPPAWTRDQTDWGPGNVLISTEGSDHSEDSAVRISDQ